MPAAPTLHSQPYHDPPQVSPGDVVLWVGEGLGEEKEQRGALCEGTAAEEEKESNFIDL